jgi:hypothetical protein
MPKIDWKEKCEGAENQLADYKQAVESAPSESLGDVVSLGLAERKTVKQFIRRTILWKKAGRK